MDVAWYLASWFCNLLLIAVVVGIVGRTLKVRIEEHRILAAFFIFVLPLFLELASFLAAGRPFLFNLAS
jgi:hypothetical protein